MQTRNLELNVGDWSGDGHGRTETTMISVCGEDVSNEALRRAYEAACTKLNIDPLAMACNNEEMPGELLRALIQEGFPYANSKRDVMGSFMVEDGYEKEFPYNVNLDELIIWMIHTELSIAYYFPEKGDVLFGGYNSILSPLSDTGSSQVFYEQFMF